MKLVKYEAARHALAEAKSVDEVKSIRDKAMAMSLYAKQAKDKDLELWAFEIRLRAERRAGEMLAEMELEEKKGQHGLKAAGKLSRLPEGNLPPKLSDLGVTKKQSSTWQRLSKVPTKVFEEAVKKGVRPPLPPSNTSATKRTKAPEIEVETAPEGFRFFFLAGAEEAALLAAYKGPKGSVDEECIEAAKRVISAWTKLIPTLEALR